MAERVYHGFAESLRVEIRHVHMYQSAHDFVAGVPWLYQIADFAEHVNQRQHKWIRVYSRCRTFHDLERG